MVLDSERIAEDVTYDWFRFFNTNFSKFRNNTVLLKELFFNLSSEKGINQRFLQEFIKILIFYT